MGVGHPFVRSGLLGFSRQNFAGGPILWKRGVGTVCDLQRGLYSASFVRIGWLGSIHALHAFGCRQGKEGFSGV